MVVYVKDSLYSSDSRPYKKISPETIKNKKKTGEKRDI